MNEVFCKMFPCPGCSFSSLRYSAKCFSALAAHSHPQTNQGYLRIFGKLIGVSLSYIHSSVGIVIVASLPRIIYYGTFAMFISFPKLCPAMHVPNFMEMNRLQNHISHKYPSILSIEKRSQLGLRATSFKSCFSP